MENYPVMSVEFNEAKTIDDPIPDPCAKAHGNTEILLHTRECIAPGFSQGIN
jgi:hypothetical protein